MTHGSGTTRRAGRRPPRSLHPIAWWLWAASLGVAASRTSNPLLLLLILAVLGYVVAVRRGEAPWARGFRYYLWFALVVVAIRVAFRSVFASASSPADHILFTLPRLPMPHWFSGVRIGGPVSLEATLSAGIDGLRLGVLLCCLGAANTLANPKRALRVLPGALYELGVAVTVSISVAPQLLDSAQRVARARRLRAGSAHGLRALRSIAVPVLADALDRSLKLAAAMDCRGYGRTGRASRGARRLTAALMLFGLLALAAGSYGLADPNAPAALGLPALVAGGVLCAGALALGGRRVSRSSYRPDPWQRPEWLVTGTGIASAVLLDLTAGFDPSGVNPSLYPLHWPSLPVLPTVAVLLAALAGVASPPPQPDRHRSPRPEAPTEAEPTRAAA